MARAGTQGGSVEPQRSPAELAAALRELAAESGETAGWRPRADAPARVNGEPIDAPAPLLASAAEEVAAAVRIGEPAGSERAPDSASAGPEPPDWEPEGSEAPRADHDQVADELDAAPTEPLAPLESDPEVDEPAALAPEHANEPDGIGGAGAESAAAKPWTDIAWQHPGTEIAAERARRLRLGISALVTAVAVTLALVALNAFTSTPAMVRAVEHNAPVSTATTPRQTAPVHRQVKRHVTRRARARARAAARRRARAARRRHAAARRRTAAARRRNAAARRRAARHRKHG